MIMKHLEMFLLISQMFQLHEAHLNCHILMIRVFAPIIPTGDELTDSNIGITRLCSQLHQGTLAEFLMLGKPMRVVMFKKDVNT